MIYEQKKQFTFNDIDANWDVSLTAILKYMAEASWKNGEDLGVGIGQISQSGLAFIIQRLAIKIISPPALGDEFVLRTWVGDIGKFACHRYGEIIDLKGNKLIEWDSLWVLYDTNERKIKRTKALPFDVQLYGDLNTTIKTKKIHLPEIEAVEYSTQYMHKIEFTDIDPFQHMSDTHFGNMITNVYRRDENRSTFIKKGTEIHLNYMNEGLIFDEVEVYLEEFNGEIFISGTTKKHTIFTAVIAEGR